MLSLCTGAHAGSIPVVSSMCVKPCGDMIEYFMFNKVKIAAAVAVVVVGMVLYKGWFDRKQDEKANEAVKKKAKAEKQRWN